MFILHYHCGKQNMTSKDAHILNLETVNLLLYMAKAILQM